MSRSSWDHEPVDDRWTDLLMPAPAIAPHDAGALFRDDSGDCNSGHATACVSRQYLGSRGQVGNGIVAATKGPPAAHLVVRARAACVAFRALAADGLCNPGG